MENPLFTGISPWWLEILSKLKMTLNHLYVLEKAIAGEDVSRYKEYKMLVSVGWISSEGKVMPIGEGFYNALKVSPEPDGKKRVQITGVANLFQEEFEKWWAAYPSSAQFTYKQILFKSERVLRSNKQVCSSLYAKMIVEDKVSPEVLLKCLEVEIATRKEESYQHYRKENKLQYMSGAEVYLRQKKYQGYLERDMNPEEQIEKKVVYENSTDQ